MSTISPFVSCSFVYCFCVNATGDGSNYVEVEEKGNSK